MPTYVATFDWESERRPDSSATYILEAADEDEAYYAAEEHLVSSGEYSETHAATVSVKLAAPPRCMCGGVGWRDCLCGITLREFEASRPGRGLTGPI